jgi:hypothetical protein
VEVASDGISALVRDSKIDESPETRFLGNSWGVFVGALK